MKNEKTKKAITIRKRDIVKVFRVGIGLFLLLSGACNSAMNPEAAEKFIADPAHGLSKKVTAGPWVFEWAYQPGEQVALINLGKEASAHPELVEDYVEGIYLSLNLSSADGKSPSRKIEELFKGDSAKAIIQHLMFRMKENVTVTAGADTLACTFFDFIQTGEFDNRYTFLSHFTGYNPATDTADLQVSYHGELSRSSGQHFIIDHKNIKKVINIKL